MRERVQRLARPMLWLGALTLVAGCSLVPNMDYGSSGCSNAVGIGPRPDPDKPAFHQAGTSPVEGIIGLDPTAAATKAATAGHTVVFNVQIAGFGECWCVPPPGGMVESAFFTQRGALMLMVQDVPDQGHTPNDQPSAGWGC